MSGLNQYIANVPYAKVYRGFESLPLRIVVPRSPSGERGTTVFILFPADELISYRVDEARGSGKKNA